MTSDDRSSAGTSADLKPVNVESLIENLLQTCVDYERAERFDAKYLRMELEEAKQAIRNALAAPQPAAQPTRSYGALPPPGAHHQIGDPVIAASQPAGSAPDSDGRYLGYRDEHGRRMLCSHKHCPSPEKCINGCVDFGPENQAGPAQGASVTNVQKALDLLNAVAPAVESLACHQQQCDDDGVMVIVSRQAVDETVNAVNDAVIALSKPALPQPAQAPALTREAIKRAIYPFCFSGKNSDAIADAILAMQALPQAPAVTEGGGK